MNKVFLRISFMTKYNSKSKGIVHIFLIYEQSPNFMYLFMMFPKVTYLTALSSGSSPHVLWKIWKSSALSLIIPFHRSCKSAPRYWDRSVQKQSIPYPVPQCPGMVGIP